MGKYMLASDYDGTLCKNGVIAEEVIRAIDEFRQKGNIFGIVTGRDYVNGFEYLKKMNSFSFDFILANNGAAAYDSGGNIYFAERINGKQPFGNSSLAYELVKWCMLLTSNHCGISFEKSRYDFHPDYPLGGKTEKKQYLPFKDLEHVEEFILSNAICDNALQATQVTEALKKMFGKYVNPLQNGRCIDISPAGVDKATGIAKLAELLEIPFENIWTAGDNFNDMPMIKKYHGCAMAGGVEKLKDISEYVCENVSDVIKLILQK